jgi:kynurenine/2-aminoadipate aminotransferase
LYAEATPDTIFFGSGAPNAETFPFQQITVKISDDLSIDLQGRELEMALQYQPTPGYVKLYCKK